MTNHEAGGWHREVITASTEVTLRNLSHAKLLDSFYLAGGTGLALHFGHRLSQDLDFLAADLFDEETLLQRQDFNDVILPLLKMAAPRLP